MNRRRIVITIIGLLLLLVLAVYQFHSSPEWRNFRWDKFTDATAGAKRLFLLEAVGLIYLGYFLRSLRWCILMNPCGRFRDVLKGNIIGFTGIALLGRPGELVRPYYIARKHATTVAPQAAVWLLERVLDTAAVVLLVGLDLIFSSDIKETARDTIGDRKLHAAGVGLTVIFIALIAFLLLLHHYSGRFVEYLYRKLCAASPHVADRVRAYLLTLVDGLRGLGRAPTLILSIAYTLVMWLGIALAVMQIVRAYPDMADFNYPGALFLLGITLLGSLLQLPLVGGGVQAASAFGLKNFFDLDPETATSAALFIWLISFYAITPFGLALAAREGISWRNVWKQSEVPEVEAAELEARK